MLEINYPIKIIGVLLLAVGLTTACNYRRQKPNNVPKENRLANSEQPELAPNSVQLQGRIATLSTKQREQRGFNLIVQDIQGYGPSTRPVNPGDTLEIAVSSDFLKKTDVQLQTGSSYKFVLSETMDASKDQPKSIWLVTEIK